MVCIRSQVNTKNNRQLQNSGGLSILGTTEDINYALHYDYFAKRYKTLSQVTELAKDNNVATTIREESK